MKNLQPNYLLKVKNSYFYKSINIDKCSISNSTLNKPGLDPILYTYFIQLVCKGAFNKYVMQRGHGGGLR
jgi:hypothetical protein